MRHSASVFRRFQSLLLDLFATVHGQRCHGVRGQNHNGAPDKMRGGSSRGHTHRPAGINRVWDAHAHGVVDGLHVLSGVETRSLQAQLTDVINVIRLSRPLYIRATTESQDTSDPDQETPDCVNRMRHRYPQPWSCRREDRNALSSLELAKRYVGKQLCHQTCETDLLLWLIIT